jgi:hypothetical protein
MRPAFGAWEGFVAIVKGCRVPSSSVFGNRFNSCNVLVQNTCFWETRPVLGGLCDVIDCHGISARLPWQIQLTVSWCSNKQLTHVLVGTVLKGMTEQ